MEHNNGYIPAGFDTYISMTTRHIHESNHQNLNKHYKNNTGGVMSCFGTCVMKNKNLQKSQEKYIEWLKEIKTNTFSKDLDMYIDSGGFQIIMGKYTKEEIDWLIDNYYKFLKENVDLYSKAFILDLPINEKCFSSYEELYEYNLKSYKLASELPKEAIDKIIYVHHFVSPKNNEIFESIFNQVDAMNNFKNFSVGGIAKRSSTHKHYINNFSIPIVFYIRKALEHNLKDIRIHFLGADNPDVVLFYKLAEKIINDKYNIDLKITYDSAIFSSTFRARKFEYINNDIMKQHKFFSKNLDKNYGSNKSMKQSIIDELNRFADKIQIDLLPDDSEIYIDGDMDQKLVGYMMAHNAYYMKELSIYLNKQATKIYECYKGGDIYNFNDICFDTVKNMRFGKVSRYAKMLINCLYDLIKTIETLDHNKTKNLIQKQTQFENYFSNNNILTV